MFRYFSFFILVLTLSSCIDALNVDTEESREILVIEGAITTLPGPHRILLSKSAKYGSILEGNIRKETGATVWVRDDSGGQVFLEEGPDGTYSSPADYRAEIGRKYTLFATLANGERYVSTPEEILPVPPIDSLIVVYKEQPSLDVIAQNTGVELYVRWQDPGDAVNFYLWEADGIYQLNANPENFVGKDGGGSPVPMPKDCCATCYVYEQGLTTDLPIYKDNLTNGSTQTEKIAYIQDDGRRFMERYMTVVRQMSLTREAYRFYDILKSQLSIQGNIFDPPPATIRGNMINLDHPDEEVIGYFRASDVQTDTLFISRSAIADPQPIRPLNDDCRVIKGSTTEKPAFWN